MLKSKNNMTYYNRICSEISASENAKPDEFGQALYNHFNTHSQIKTLSLFTGIGGLDIGFHDAGFVVTDAVEINKAACEVLEKNKTSKRYEIGRVWNIDIKNFDLPNDIDVDMIIGGPPCQSFSRAGKEEGINSLNGGMYKHYARAIETYNPKAFLFENVYALLGKSKAKDFATIRKAFTDLGYTLYYKVLDTAFYGVPQFRDRVYLIGVRDETIFQYPKSTHGNKENPYYTPKEAFSDLKEPIEPHTLDSLQNGHLIYDVPPGCNYKYYTAEYGHPTPLFESNKMFNNFLAKIDPDFPSKTILSGAPSNQNGPFHWNNRRLEITEMKRIQTIPDNYKVSESRTQAQKQIGNAVATNIARHLALAVRKTIFQEKSLVSLEFMKYDESESSRSTRLAKNKEYKMAVLKSRKS